MNAEYQSRASRRSAEQDVFVHPLDSWRAIRVRSQMSKMPKKAAKRGYVRHTSTDPPSPAEFDEVLRLIDAARTRGGCCRQHHAHRALLEHRRGHQPQD